MSRLPPFVTKGEENTPNYLSIRGGSLKKIAKKIIPNVPINKNVYTSASIRN